MSKAKIATDKEIGALVRERRYKKEMGQPQLAEALGVSPMMIQKYETGASPLTVVKLLMIADTLRCKVKDLLP